MCLNDTLRFQCENYRYQNMNTINEHDNCAEAMDLMNIRIAVGLLMVSVAYALEASVHLMPAAYATWLDRSTLALGLFAMAWIVRAIGPTLWRKLRNKTWQLHKPESFVTQAFNQALNKSWLITFVTIVFLKSIDKLLGKADLPIEFFLKALVFLMMFSASVIFLVLIRTDDKEAGFD